MLVASFFSHACYPHTILKLLELHTMLLAFFSSSSCLLSYVLQQCIPRSTCLTICLLYILFAHFMVYTLDILLTLRFAFWICIPLAMDTTKQHKNAAHKLTKHLQLHDFLKFTCSYQWLEILQNYMCKNLFKNKSQCNKKARSRVKGKKKVVKLIYDENE